MTYIYITLKALNEKMILKILELYKI